MKKVMWSSTIISNHMNLRPIDAFSDTLNYQPEGTDKVNLNLLEFRKRMTS